MTIIVKAWTAIRFKRRWQDYLRVMEEGTSPLVGRAEPKPRDERKAIEAALADGTAGVAEADTILDRVWTRDTTAWPKRLRKPFLDGFSRRAHDAFATLVKKGSQPDMLALQFHKATQTKEYEADHVRIRNDLDELEKLSAQAVATVGALAIRRRQFDEFLVKRQLRASYGEPGDAELQILKLDLEESVERHLADDRRLTQQNDGRRESLLGHAEVRLSRQVQEATGSYCDRDVEDVLGELRERLGLADRSHGSLKRRRARWNQQIRGREETESE
ncbi:MAG: hypothetical protein Q7R30_11395 [Acidobacteriota bacterium]|nr:hypothetical protein [Acidobacteriota bacterium]